MNKSDWLALLLAILIVIGIWGVFWWGLKDVKPQPDYAILKTVELVYGSKVEEGTAQVSEDLAKYIGYGFNYPDRGIVLIVGTVNDFSKNRVYIRGHNVSRKASLLMMNREMIKRIKIGENYE